MAKGQHVGTLLRQAALRLEAGEHVLQVRRGDCLQESGKVAPEQRRVDREIVTEATQSGGVLKTRGSNDHSIRG